MSCMEDVGEHERFEKKGFDKLEGSWRVEFGRPSAVNCLFDKGFDVHGFRGEMPL